MTPPLESPVRVPRQKQGNRRVLSSAEPHGAGVCVCAPVSVACSHGVLQTTFSLPVESVVPPAVSLHTAQGLAAAGAQGMFAEWIKK